MKTYYSIIYVTLRSATSERLSLGLLLFNNNDVYYKFSSSKLNAVKILIGKNAYKTVNDSLKTLGIKVDEDNSDYTKNSGFKIFKNHELDITFSNNYISYLSRYKNNLISYSEPKEIDVDVNSSSLSKLYHNFIGDLVDEKSVIYQENLHPLNTFKNCFQNKIENHFLESLTITYEHVPNLIVPVQVDFVGRNGIDVFVQTIDTSSQPGTMIKDVSTFYLLKETYKKNNTPLKDFLLSKEPPQQLKKQHDLWMHFYKSKEFNYVDISEANRIIEYAEENGVKPFFGNEEVMIESPF